MIEDIQDISILIKRIEEEIRNREPRKGNIKVLRSLYLLRSIQQRLERIKSLLEIEKYDLVFIGQVGVGKTTTICHLLNLTRTVEKAISIKSKRSESKSKTIEVTKEILSTGSGKTTICEVIIQPAISDFIEIEPYSNEEVEEFLEEFCNYTWQRIYPDESVVIKSPPAELRRAIRNMVDLKEVTENKIFVDKAEKLAQTFSEDQYADFKQSVFERAQLAARTKRKLEYTAQNKPSVKSRKEWLETAFSNLNLVKIPDFSMPKKIIVNVSPEILDFSQLSPFKSVIDTRGMDVVKDRKDIEDYVRNNDAAICVFTDGFPAAPTNVAELISRYLSLESKDIDTKLALLVLPRKGEPEAILGSDGPVEDIEEGIAIRKNDIVSTLAGQKIKFLSANILFYNPLLYYNADGRIDPDYSNEEVQVEREHFLDELKNIVHFRKLALLKDASNRESTFYKVINYEDLDDDDEALITDLKKTIKKCGELCNIDNRVTLSFTQFLKSQHVMVFRAINNRFGIYDMRDIDIYFETKGIVENLCRQNLKTLKSKIDGAIKLVKEHASSLSGLQPIMDILQDQIDQNFEAIVITYGQEISLILRNEKLAPQTFDNPFWHEAQTRWGQGPGYRNDVLEMYAENLNGIDDLFQTGVQQLWEDEFMKKILTFFGDGEN